MDSVLSEVDTQRLANKIASRCGAMDQGSRHIDKHASKQTFAGQGKEVVLMKLDPLPEQKAAVSKSAKLQSFSMHGIVVTTVMIHS